MKKIQVFVIGLFLSVTFASAQQIITAEYFIDTDPGFGAGNPVSFVADSLVSIDSIPVNVSGLSIGYHWLSLRVKDSNNAWSVYRNQRFYVYDNSPIIQPVDTTKLVQAEYWIDSLAVVGTGTLISLNPQDTIFYNDSIPGLQLDTGSHIVSVRVKDSKGNWSFIKSDSVRIEVYDVDIDVLSAPFYRTGFWGKMEVSLKNRGNKDIYDAFIMVKTSNVDSVMLTSETDSLYGFPYKAESAIVPFNDIDFVPVWLYKLPKQAITKFDLYFKFKSTSLVVGKTPLEFDVLFDDENRYDTPFLLSGDTSDFKASRLSSSIKKLIYIEQLNQPNFNLADSIIEHKIDSCLKNISSIFSKPVLINKITKSIINQGFNLFIDDSTSNKYETDVFHNIRDSYFDTEGYDEDAYLRMESSAAGCIQPPLCTPCTFNCSFAPPFTEISNFNITSKGCIDRCKCICLPAPLAIQTQQLVPHHGYDISINNNLINNPSKSDWNTESIPVIALCTGTATSTIKNGYGKTVDLVCPCGANSITVRYAHLNPNLFSANGSITAGDTIGYAGSSKTKKDINGNTILIPHNPGNTHLHIEIRNSSNEPCNIDNIMAGFGYGLKSKDVEQPKPCDPAPLPNLDPCIKEKPRECNCVNFNSELSSCPPPKKKDICKDPKVLNNWDPNDKVGNTGFAPPRYINPTDELQYGVLFENVDSATVPTHVVSIKDTLDLTKVNASSFYFESITAGEMLIVIPDTIHLQHLDTLYKEVPINNCYVHAVADFDSSTGAIEFTLTSVETSDTIPPYTPVQGVFEGFLPPDTTNFHGNGLVTFKVMPVSSIPDDTVIYNTAHIIFDSNPAIVTGTWLNTIDRIAPTSNVIALAPITYDTSFVVNWIGTDDGAGIVAYDIYSKTSGDTAFTKWLDYTSLVADTFHGVWDSTYQFYSIAYDSVGNVENKLALIEASTTLQNPVGINYIYNSTDLKIYPNPTAGKLIIEAELEKNGKLNVEIYNLLNQKLLSFEGDDSNNKYYKKEIDVSNQADGVYFIHLKVDGQNITKKFILKKN